MAPSVTTSSAAAAIANRANKERNIVRNCLRRKFVFKTSNSNRVRRVSSRPYRRCRRGRADVSLYGLSPGMANVVRD